MEPAVKPAAEHSHTGVVGVIATPATFQGRLYGSVVERFAEGVTLMQDTCPGLVEQIEAGKLDDPITDSILHNALGKMITAGIDTVVLGCTHFPFVIPAIKRIVGEDVRVIDPAPAIARQVGRLLDKHHLHTNSTAPGITDFRTTGSPESMINFLTHLNISGDVNHIPWEEINSKMK
jgi:glutamate racemase